MHAHICNNYKTQLDKYLLPCNSSFRENRLYRLQVDLGGIPGGSVSMADAELLTVGRIFILYQWNY